jgi:hypothetical protein
MTGHLHPPERKLLNDTIIELKPQLCLECGTWAGGGSAFSIVSGLHANNKGILHTFEVNKGLHDMAVKAYQTEVPEMLPFIKLYLEDFYDGVILRDFQNVDFCFFDGPEDSEYSMKILQMMEPRIKIGGFIALHDWKSKPGSKCFSVQPYLLNSPQWKMICILDTEVGIAKFQKIG